MNPNDLPLSVTWEKDSLFLLDQTKLPHKVVIEKQETLEDVWHSIKILKVRGAPAIGLAGAYGLLVGLQPYQKLDNKKFLHKTKEFSKYLNSSRPTAVNLSWALDLLVGVAESNQRESSEEIFNQMKKMALQIHDEDRKSCREIGIAGSVLIDNKMGILTHCNAGSLAVSELGTALSPMYTAFQQGKKFSIYADETRPLLQGARLTAWELQQSGLDVTLICDGMAAALMSQGFIQLVIVGADRVAANGDTANKIGTLGVAIAANYYKIPFYIACPYSTIDFNTMSGEQIEIEERDSEEVTHLGGRRIAPEGIRVRNPAFDVTPHKLIKGIITEKGIISSPFFQNLVQ